MNRDSGISETFSSHPAETQKPLTETARERAHSFIENIIHAEPIEDSTAVWQYSAMKAEQAVAREEYPEAERLYLEAWSSLPKKDRDSLRMHYILNPLVSLYRTRQRHDEATALQLEINAAYRRLSWQGTDMLDQYLSNERLNEVRKKLTTLLRLLRQTNPIINIIEDYEWFYSNKESIETEVSLDYLCETIEEFTYDIRICCHELKAREHVLKAFLVETEGFQEVVDEKTAEIVRAREEAQNELQYYAHELGRLTDRLVTSGELACILQRDLPGLSQRDRAKLEQYEEIYRYLDPMDEEAWERFPIVEILDIAKAYLPGMQRQQEEATGADTQ